MFGTDGPHSPSVPIPASPRSGYHPRMTNPTTFRITLPVPPSVNHQYINVGTGRKLSREAMTYKVDVAKAVDRSRSAGILTPEIEATFKDSLLGAYLTFYFQTPFRRDLDGGLKIALDALCQAVGLDDRSVVDLHLTKQVDTLHPRLEFELEAITDWTFDRSYVYLGEPATEATDDADGGDHETIATTGE